MVLAIERACLSRCMTAITSVWAKVDGAGAVRGNGECEDGGNRHPVAGAGEGAGGDDAMSGHPLHSRASGWLLLPHSPQRQPVRSGGGGSGGFVKVEGWVDVKVLPAAIVAELGKGVCCTGGVIKGAALDISLE